MDTSSGPIQTPKVVDEADRPLGFGYYLIYASPEKYDETVRFYQTLLGGSVLAAPEGLSAEQMNRVLEGLIVVVKRPDLPQSKAPFSPGVLHIAWFYNSLAEMMTVYKHARDQGLKPGELMNSGVLMQMYFYDPEGNEFEIGVDAHDTSEAAQNAMSDVEGKRVPGGGIDHWRYDPEKVLKMLEAGISDYDIFRHETYHELAASGRF